MNILKLFGYQQDEPVFFITRRELTKTVAVATAALAFFAVQMNKTTLFAQQAALGCAVITIISEKTIRNRGHLQTDWFNTNNLHPKLSEQLILHTIEVAFIFFAFAIILGPVTHPIVLAVQAKNIYAVFLHVICNPISEEILFRGFVQERVEDILILFGKITGKPIGDEQKIAAVVQSCLFGLTDTAINGQTRIVAKIVSMTLSTVVAYFLTERKHTDASLIVPMGIRVVVESGMAVGLSLASFFQK